MSRKRVYFSKSNECDPNDARAVHEILNSLDIEVVEFKGGKYDPAIVDDCEYILFLPPKNSLNPGTEGSGESTYDIGKGQYDQFERFLNSDHEDNTYIVSGICGNTILVDYIDTYEEHESEDQSWGNYYGYFETDQAMKDFRVHLGMAEDVKSEVTYDLSDDFETMVAQMEKELVRVAPASPKPAMVWMGTRSLQLEEGPMLAAAAYLGLI